MRLPGADTIPVDTERLKDTILRFGLIATAVFLWASLDQLPSKDTLPDGSLVWLQAIEGVFSFVLIILAIRGRLFKWVGWLIPCALLITIANRVLVYAVDIHEHGYWGLDIYIYADYAARLFRLGQNPYQYDLYDSFRVLGTASSFTTPLLQGDYTGGLVYPPLSFLVLVPFQALNIIPSYYAYVLVFVLCLGIMYWGTPNSLRPLILLPWFLQPDYVWLAVVGLNDTLWLFPILMMILNWKHERQRAFWFGLSCAVKQQPWVIAPFLLIRIWHEYASMSDRRQQALLRFIGISAGVFLAINLPFLLWDLKAWLNGNLEPVLSNMIVLGSGLSRLAMFSVVAFPKPLYGVFALLTLGTLLVVYWRHFTKWRELIWMVPALIFWLNYRSLTSYYLFWMMPLAFSLVRNQLLIPAQPETASSTTSNKLSMVLLTGTVLVIVGTIGWYIARPNPIRIEVSRPIVTYGDWVQSLKVNVENDGDRALTPRFTVFGTFTHQPVFWHIKDGPNEVAPGESAEFTIEGQPPVLGFQWFNRVQIIVSDANDYALRAAAVLEGDIASAYPVGLPNGNYAFWSIVQNAPTAWGLRAEPNNPNPVNPVEFENGQRGLRFNLTGAAREEWSMTTVGTEIMFPHTPVQIWVKPPAGANVAPEFDLAYGLELEANGKKIWVLFGDTASSGEIEPGLYYWMTPAPRETWSLQTVDLRHIFAELGFEVLDLDTQSVRRFENHDYPATALLFRLLLGARHQSSDVVTADFGSLSNTDLTADHTALVQDAIDHPERILLWRAEHHNEARSYDLAENFANQVLAIQPDEARAYLQLGWAQFGLGSDAEAQQSFEQAQALMDAHPERYSTYNQADAYAGQAWLLLRQKECFQAALLFEQARTTNTEYPYPEDALTTCGTIIPKQEQ